MKTSQIKTLSVAALVVSAALSSQAAVSMSPLLSFGGGDGWLAPGEGGYTFLGTGNNERGMAYGNGHVYLVSRNGGSNVRILSSTTGADIGSLNVTGVSGGTFAVSSVSVGGDGVIYVANLTTAASGGSPYKIYSWATEASAPVTAFSGLALAGARVGDDMAIIGSGSSTRIAAGFNSTPAVTGNNGYTIVNPNTGTSTEVAFSGTPPNAGDFRLGITFLDSSHIIGTAGSTLYRDTSFSGTSGTLLGSPGITTSAERPMSFATIAGIPLLATISSGDSTVRVYDLTDPLAPLLLAFGNNTSGTLTVNGNATGALAWGDLVGNQVPLYAMSSNQGIQAFLVTIPEPSAIVLGGMGALGLLLARRRRNAR